MALQGTDTPVAAQANAADTAFFGHPAGLSTLFFTDMWERFSYYGIRPLLLLFMTAAVGQGGFGFSNAESAAIVGIYAGAVYLLALPGGWLADNWLGARRAVLAGAVLIALGHLAIGLSAVLAKPAFFAGLMLIPLGSGLMKPSISSMVGALYAHDDVRRDSGFSIFYMSVNIGAFFGALVTGFLGERIGWHWGFAAAGAAMLIGLVVYAARMPKTLMEIGGPPLVSRAKARNIRLGLLACVTLLVALYTAAVAGLVVLRPEDIATRLGEALGLITVVYLGYLFFFAGFGSADRRRVLMIVVLFVVASVFWAALEQAPTSMNLFARDFTDRTIGGVEFPATWLQSLNPVYIILLTPVLGYIWTSVRRRGIALEKPVQFMLGLGFACAGFVVLALGARAAQSGHLVSPFWLLGSVFLQVIGELCLSPVGLNAFTQLAPEGWSSRMLGVWFMASSIGNLLAGLAGGHIEAGDARGAEVLFQFSAGVLLAAAVALALLIRPLRRMLQSSPDVTVTVPTAPLSGDP